MPDIARWNGIDQLAESYLSTSPYAYVANNPVLMTDPDGRWMDDSGHITDTTGQTFGLHGSSYRPLLSFSTNDGMHTNEGAGVTDNGNNRIGQGPKPNIFKRIGNFFRRLAGRNKGAGISSFVPGATIGRIPIVEVGEPTRIAEFFSTIEATSVAVGAATLGAVLTPVMMKDPEYNWARDLPFNVPVTGATDVPDDGSDNLYLYRNMRSVNGMPMVGEGLDKLGLRDKDVNFLSNSTMITPLFSNGLSVTIGYGNTIPSDVPDTHKKQILFRISASSLVSYGLIGTPVPNTSNPFYGQIRPAIPMNVGTFRALIQTTAPAWQPVK
jgi:hypothetical protein